MELHAIRWCNKTTGMNELERIDYSVCIGIVVIDVSADVIAICRLPHLSEGDIWFFVCIYDIIK